MKFSLFAAVLTLFVEVTFILPQNTLAQEITQQQLSSPLDQDYKLSLAKLLASGEQSLVSNNVDGAIAKYQQAYQLSQTQGNIIDQSRILGILGRVYDFNGNYAKAETAYQQGIALLPRRSPDDLPRLDRLKQEYVRISLLTGLGITYKKIGQLPQASQQLQLAISLSKNIPSIRDHIHIEPRFELGNVYKREGKYQQAIALYQECRELLRQKGDRAGEDLVLTAIGNTYALMGNLKKGREFHNLRSKLPNTAQNLDRNLDLERVKNRHKDLDEVDASLQDLNNYLSRSIPLIRQTSDELFKMHALVSSDARFDVIRRLGTEMRFTSDQMIALVNALNGGDIFSAYGMIEKLDKVMTNLTGYEKELDILMESVQNNPENYPVLTPRVLQEFTEISKNLDRINQSLTGKSKSNSSITKDWHSFVKSLKKSQCNPSLNLT